MKNKTNDTKNTFTQVSYRDFREILSSISLGDTGDHGRDTFISDHAGEVKAVVRAASIDIGGRCHSAKYYVKTASLQPSLAAA